MPCRVSVTIELDPELGVAEMEREILVAGQQAMRQALGALVDAYERAHRCCTQCGSADSRSQGTVPRWVLTRFGRVVAPLLGVRTPVSPSDGRPD